MKDPRMGKILQWVTGSALGVLMIIFSELTIIVATKMLGVVKATLFRVVFTIPASWLVIYLATRSNISDRFARWLSDKEARLSKRTQVAVAGGKYFAVLNTALFLGPILASVLMLMFGLRARRVYVYAVPCALLCALFWCAFYSGMFWGIAKIFVS